jgi:hypothetical protein
MTSISPASANANANDITTYWKNEDSIYHYLPAAFRDYVEVIADRDAIVIDILQRARIRETKCLPKNLAKLKIEELRHNPHQIKQVYDALRHGMQPMSKLSLPYTKEERRQELIDNLAATHNIVKSKAKCRVVKGHYNAGTRANSELNFHYVFEIVAAPYRDESGCPDGHVDFIGMVNNRPSGIDDGAGFFTGAPGTYKWHDKKYGMELRAATIREILHQCGFNQELSPLKRKRPCVFMANLICPALDYSGNYGKSRITNLSVFADKIVEATVPIAKEMPTFHGYGYDGSEKTASEKTLEQYVYDVLLKRWQAVNQNPSLKINERWTLSTVWYNLRPILIAAGYEPKGKHGWGGTRKTIHSLVDKICWKYFHKPREELSIYASPWAIMYYHEQAYPVNFGAISGLSELGTDIILIEKEGIVNVLSPFAKDYGIALVNTKGRTTKYVRKLVKLAIKAGARVSILTDDDAVGIQIWHDVIKNTKIPRIGIDRIQTIKYFQEHGFPDLRQEDIEEKYNPKVSTSNMEDGEYLSHHRIELDSLLAKVGAKALWGYVKHQLLEAFPEGRDYNRVIQNPKPIHKNGNVYPYAINVVLHYLELLHETVTADIWAKLEYDLEAVKNKLYVLEDKIEELKKDEIRPVITKNKYFKLVIEKFVEIAELIRLGKLPSLEDLKEQQQYHQQEDWERQQHRQKQKDMAIMEEGVGGGDDDEPEEDNGEGLL